MLLLLAVASAVVAVVTSLTLQQFLMGRLDEDLRATSAVFVRFAFPPAGAPGPPVPFPADDRGPRPPDTLVAEIDGDRVVSAVTITREGGTQAVPSGELPDLAAVPADGRPRSVDLGPLGRYRLLAVLTPGPHGCSSRVSRSGRSRTPCSAS